MGKFFDKSVFANYFLVDDAEALAWAENVLEKLKEVGLVPEYIQREDADIGDTDFEDYYRPIAIFFAYLVKLARTFEDFKDNSFLANEYLNQHGQFTSGNETLDQLVYAIENALRVRAQRGGTKPIEASTDEDTPDGELLRLIGWDGETFFKLGVAAAKKNSWNIDNSSPLYRGNTGRYDLNVGYEYTEDVLALEPYPLINPESIEIATHRGKQCIKIQYDGIEECGIGADEPIGSDEESKRILVDPRINFEITIYVAQSITEENLSFSVLAFDVDGNPVSLKSVVDGSDRNFFFETRRLNQAGNFYFIRGILFNKDKQFVSEDNAKLNIGFGQNLIMPENVAYFIPKFVVDNNFLDDTDSQEDNFDSLDFDFDSSAFLDANFLPTPNNWSDMVAPYTFTKTTSEFSYNGNLDAGLALRVTTDPPPLGVASRVRFKINIDFVSTPGPLAGLDFWFQFFDSTVNHMNVYVNGVLQTSPYITGVLNTDTVFEMDVPADSINIFDTLQIIMFANSTGNYNFSLNISDQEFVDVSSVYLWNMKVTPASTEYSRCYLDNKNFIDIYLDNTSRKYSNEEIEVFLRKYFIPLDTAFKTIHLGESFEVESNYVLLENGDYFLLEDESRLLLE